MTTALVTGASKGLGAALAEELAKRGHDLVLVARSADTLATLAERLGGLYGVRATVVAVDLADKDGQRRVAGLARDVDLLVNNAGAGQVGPFLQRPFAQATTSVDLNVSALIALTHAAATGMAERGGGAIVNVGSTAAFQPMAYQAVYAATKAFLLSFTEALAEEMRGTGVHVMTANPGSVATDFFHDTTAAGKLDKAIAPERVAARILDDLKRGKRASYPGSAYDRAATWYGRFTTRTTAARSTAAINRRLGLHLVQDL